MSIVQIGLSVFLLFAVSRVFLRFQSGEVSSGGLMFWTGIFGSALLVVNFPDIASALALFVGIGRGVDVVIYGSLVLMFYLIFRLYVYVQDIRHEITEIVQQLALKDSERQDDTSSHH